jgi:hypothetical protein
MPSKNTRRNSMDSVVSAHEYDSEYEPSVVSDHDDDREWNNADLDDEVVATGIIQGSTVTGTRRSERIRSRTNRGVEHGSRRSERIRTKTVARIMIETNLGPRTRK